MKKRILTIISFTIIMGVIALALNTAFGNQTISYLQRVRVQTITGDLYYYYKYDFYGYFYNLNTSVTDTSTLSLALPTRTWIPVQGVDWWVPLGNDLALILDYIFLIINILLYPIRIGAYLVKNVLALIGMNMQESEDNGLYWLATLVNWLIQRVAIPYI